MSLYPSLEDMKTDQMVAPFPGAGPVYPALQPYMGLELSEDVIRLNMPEYRVAPLSGHSLGLQKAQVTNAVRQVVLCKDQDNKVSLGDPQCPL